MHRHLLPRPLRSAVAAAAVLLLLAGCGSDDDNADTAGGDDGGTTTDGSYDYGNGGTGGGEAASDAIVARDYSLSGITVGPGEEIKMKNTGTETHTATADNGEFDLGEVEPGKTSKPGKAPMEPGAYPFHCEIHDTMTATLTVEG